MEDRRPKTVNRASLTDDEIVSENGLHRRAFLGATGIFLAGGAAAVVAGARGVAQQVSQSDQPRPADQPPPTDPPSPTDARPADTYKETDDEKKRRKKEREREEKERERRSDPDKPRPTDPAPPQ